MTFEYLNFDLEISEAVDSVYPVAVIYSPAGEARATFSLPWDTSALEIMTDQIQFALAEPDPAKRGLIQEVGQTLFDTIFSSEIGDRFEVSKVMARQQAKGLRLRLRIRANELAMLPWEFLYDMRQADYIGLSGHTIIVRYLEIPQPVELLTLTSPLRILGMVAAPVDLATLDVAQEKPRINTAVQHLQEQNLVELVWVEGQGWSDLQRGLRHGPWHILHWIGHGKFDQTTGQGFVAFVAESGLADFLDAQELARLLSKQLALRLVLLNGCSTARSAQADIFSSTAAEVIRHGIPTVIAMQYSITDQAAIHFVKVFYEALADGMTVDAAIGEARTAISLQVRNTLEWGIPVFYTRTDDGRLFNILQEKSPPISTSLEQQADDQDRTKPLFSVDISGGTVGSVVNVEHLEGGLTISTNPPKS